MFSDMQLFEATRIVDASPTRRPILETVRIQDMNEALTPGMYFNLFRSIFYLPNSCFQD